MTPRKPYKILLATLVVLSLVFIVWFLSGTSGDPRLEVRFLSETNNSGQLVASFAVTNSGNSSAISSYAGIVEVSSNQTMNVSCRYSRRRLLPGEGDILQVSLPPNLQGRWRFTALYAHEGTRGRFFLLQFGPHGPGERINPLIPGSLRGLPLNVKARSEWIDDAQPTNNAIRPPPIPIESVGNAEDSK